MDHTHSVEELLGFRGPDLGQVFHPDTCPWKEQEEPHSVLFRQIKPQIGFRTCFPQKCKYDRSGLDWTLFFSLRTEENSGWPRRTISSKDSSKLEDCDEAKTTCVTVGRSNYPPATIHFLNFVSQFQLPRAGSVWIEAEMLLGYPCIWDGLI
jgi:hypothetical protein